MALGFVTDEKTTVWLLVGLVTFADLEIRSSDAVELFVTQPDASPKLVGCEATALLAEKPVGVLHVPLAESQGTKEADFITELLGRVKLNVYVVLALGAELPIVILRPVICAADTVAVATGNNDTAATRRILPSTLAFFVNAKR